MVDKEILEAITKIEERIKKLPQGYISKKIIKSECYYYHQWQEDGVKRSKYVSGEELEALVLAFEEKRNLQSRLFALRKGDIHYKSRYSLLRFNLMHKDTEVAEVIIDENCGRLTQVTKIYNARHFPMGTLEEDSFKRLAEWWDERSIPASRSGLKEALEKLDINSPRLLLTKCYGLSLSDQYWIKPIESNLSWKSVNFFENEFSEDLGELLFGKDKDNQNLNLSSPDSTSIGNLKKRWKIIDDQRILVKGGSNPYRQEPINEVVASKIMEYLNIPHIDYQMMFSLGYPYCECSDFIDINCDFVSAYQINQVLKKNNDESPYSHFLRCANSLGIPNVKEFLNQMIVIDFIIANEDRHFNNFGAIRNVDSLEFVSMAPIFDSGSCLGFDKIPEDIVKQNLVESKPFKKNPFEQLDLVDDYSFLKDKDLDQIPIIANNILIEYKDDRLDDKRIDAIVKSIRTRIDYLKEKIA